MQNKDSLYTVHETAARFGVVPKTIQRWAKAGKIPAIKLPGGSWRFHKETIDRLLEERAK